MKRSKLRRRYGRAGHPLFPRVVVYLEKVSPTRYVVSAKLQPHYNAKWESLIEFHYDNVQSARKAYRESGPRLAERFHIPASRVEYA
jgi:hypothetical protein